jgi:HSP20 family molecular chaperone IbpA
MFAGTRGEFRVDIREHEDEVIVAADLQGVEKETGSLNLLNPRALETSCKRNRNPKRKRKGTMSANGSLVPCAASWHGLRMSWNPSLPLKE